MKTLFIAFLTLASISAGAAENPAKQIKKQMCFETYPRTTYDQNGTHEWTINEVIDTPGVYKTYKLITANKTKTGDEVIFDFTGISRQYDRVIGVNGSAFYTADEGWTLNVNASTKLGNRSSAGNEPYAASLATWDMYTNITDPGTGGNFVKFELAGPNATSTSFYEVSVVRSIDCKDFTRTVPTVE